MNAYLLCSLVTHLYPTLCDLINCSLPDSSVHVILQARILEWVAIFFSSGSFPPRDWTQVSYGSCVGRQILYQWAIWEACMFSVTSNNAFWGKSNLIHDEANKGQNSSWIYLTFKFYYNVTDHIFYIYVWWS